MKACLLIAVVAIFLLVVHCSENFHGTADADELAKRGPRFGFRIGRIGRHLGRLFRGRRRGPRRHPSTRRRRVSPGDIADVTGGVSDVIDTVANVHDLAGGGGNENY